MTEQVHKTRQDIDDVIDTLINVIGTAVSLSTAQQAARGAISISQAQNDLRSIAKALRMGQEKSPVVAERVALVLDEHADALDDISEGAARYLPN